MSVQRHYLISYSWPSGSRSCWLQKDVRTAFQILWCAIRVEYRCELAPSYLPRDGKFRCSKPSGCLLSPLPGLVLGWLTLWDLALIILVQKCLSMPWMCPSHHCKLDMKSCDVWFCFVHNVKDFYLFQFHPFSFGTEILSSFCAKLVLHMIRLLL